MIAGIQVGREDTEGGTTSAREVIWKEHTGGVTEAVAGVLEKGAEVGEAAGEVVVTTGET